jgi:hypothetical protein
MVDKVILLPTYLDKVADIISANRIVSAVTLEQDRSSGVGQVTTMSWHADVNGYFTKMTVQINGVEDW